MDLALQRDFTIPRKVFFSLLGVSLLWLNFDGLMIPVGAIAAIRYVGKNFETTFLRSLVSGYRPVLAFCAVAAVGLLAAPKLSVQLAHGFMIGFSLPIRL